MEIEEFKTLLKERLGPPQVKSSFSNWTDLLEQFNKFDPKDNCYYMLTVGKGTNDEARSRFLTYTEALEVIIAEVEKAKACAT